MEQVYTNPNAAEWWLNPLAPADLCGECGTNLRDGLNVRPCPICQEAS